ncbi:Crp/Fnr family transcriptional regulator [Shinella sp. JR1-6]|nr:Crp/Fnr family transcriptional regulator [Shinella sp. JR1-6]
MTKSVRKRLHRARAGTLLQADPNARMHHDQGREGVNFLVCGGMKFAVAFVYPSRANKFTWLQTGQLVQPNASRQMARVQRRFSSRASGGLVLVRIKPEECVAIKLFEHIAGMALANRGLVAEAVELRHVRAGETLFSQDEAHPYVYVVRQGLLKLTYLNRQGEEWIKSLVAEGQFFASLSALRSGQASFSVSAIEACVLERLPFTLLEQMADRDLSWSRMVRHALMIFAERKERRERQFLTMTAEARYRLLLDEEPHLVARVPQKDLASHLGVTPVGLSRIARRVRESGHAT